MMLHCRFRGPGRDWAVVGWYLSWWSYRLLFSTSWYSGVALSNASLVDEISLNLFLMARGMFLSMDGG